LKDRRPADSKARELSISRVFDAPRDLVWKAWTTPRLVAQWWGPTGFTTTIEEMGVRPGGTWRHVMHGPDGTDYPNEIVFAEVVKPERLVYDHVQPPFHVVVTLNEKGSKTELAMRMLFPSPEERKLAIEKYHADEGLKQTIGRLEGHLKKMAGRGNGARRTSSETPTD
jgi:uncharacterized protein YndB with AHSA1/START domain